MNKIIYNPAKYEPANDDAIVVEFLKDLAVIRSIETKIALSLDKFAKGLSADTEIDIAEEDTVLTLRWLFGAVHN